MDGEFLNLENLKKKLNSNFYLLQTTETLFQLYSVLGQNQRLHEFLLKPHSSVKSVYAWVQLVEKIIS